MPTSTGRRWGRSSTAGRWCSTRRSQGKRPFASRACSPARWAPPPAVSAAATSSAASTSGSVSSSAPATVLPTAAITPSPPPFPAPVHSTQGGPGPVPRCARRVGQVDGLQDAHEQAARRPARSAESHLGPPLARLPTALAPREPACSTDDASAPCVSLWCCQASPRSPPPIWRPTPPSTARCLRPYADAPPPTPARQPATGTKPRLAASSG